MSDDEDAIVLFIESNANLYFFFRASQTESRMEFDLYNSFIHEMVESCTMEMANANEDENPNEK